MNLKFPWQKIASTSKKILLNCLPYLLVAAFTAATVYTFMGDEYTARKQQAVISTKEELAQQQQELDAALAQTQAAINQLNAISGNTQLLIDKADLEENEMILKIQELMDTYEKVANQEAQRWVCPMRFQRISSSYGYREHPIDGEGKFHHGVDLAGDYGIPIVAARSGVVEIAEYIEDDSGYWVLINHLDGYDSRYMHMAKYIVTEGQFVVAGQVIGYNGASGAATGNHLHFCIYKNNESVNPADYIDLS